MSKIGEIMVHDVSLISLYKKEVQPCLDPVQFEVVCLSVVCMRFGIEEYERFSF